MENQQKKVKCVDYIPYGQQYIDDDDINAVVETLKSGMLTTGSKVREFEEKISETLGCDYTSVVSNGTAALHCAVNAIGVKGKEVIVPAISFAATANCIVYEGGKPIFIDVYDDGSIDLDEIEELINKNTAAIIAVDFAGQKSDLFELNKLAKKYDVKLIIDAAHSFGIQNSDDFDYVDIMTFSFHPVKIITTGEGGAICTNNKELHKKIQQFRSHGIDTDYSKRKRYEYDIIDLGYNYRLTDIQCALGISQINKVHDFIDKRQCIAKYYNKAFKGLKDYIDVLNISRDCAYHLYIIIIKDKCPLTRDELFDILKEANIGVNVHYKPIYLHTYYQNIDQYSLSNAEDLYNNMLTLPIHFNLNIDQLNYIIGTIYSTIMNYGE